jgi:hypothetical protein
VTTVITTGGGGSESKDFKVKHFITGNVVDPTELKTSASKLDVCRGTNGSIPRDRPKCLLRVGDHTLLEHQLATLLALGVSKSGHG